MAKRRSGRPKSRKHRKHRRKHNAPVYFNKPKRKKRRKNPSGAWKKALKGRKGKGGRHFYRKSNPPRHHRRRHNNPAIFGLKQLEKLPLVGELFDRDMFATGAGVAFGVGLIPKFANLVLEKSGVKAMAFYATPSASGKPSIGKIAVDTLAPVAIGSVGLMAASAVGARIPGVKKAMQGFAIAGLAVGIWRLIDLVREQIPEQIRPVPSPGATADYLQEDDSVRDYLQEGDQNRIRDYLQEGDQARMNGGFGDGKMDYGIEPHLAQALAEERTF